MHGLHCSQQVKRRCRWLVSFADGELAHMASSSGDPFHGLHIDANMLGRCRFIHPLPTVSPCLWQSAVVAKYRATAVKQPELALE